MRLLIDLHSVVQTVGDKAVRIRPNGNKIRDTGTMASHVCRWLLPFV
jgi:hypothetical protein